MFDLKQPSIIYTSTLIITLSFYNKILIKERETKSCGEKAKVKSITLQFFSTSQNNKNKITILNLHTL